MVEQATFLVLKLEFENMVMSILIINPAQNQYWISNRKTEIPVWEFSSFRIYKSVEKFDQFLSNDSILCLVTSYSDFCIQSSKGWWNCQTSEMSNLLGNSTTVILRFVLNIFFGFLLLRGISTSQLTNQPVQKKN